MIDPNLIREDPDKFQRACDQKGIKLDIREFLALDQEYRQKKSEFENKRAEQNSVNKEISKLQGAEKQQRLEAMKLLAAEVKDLAALSKELEERWEAQMLRIPSPSLPRVPVGKSDAENVEIRKVGEVRKFDFTPKTHIELGAALDLFDAERGVKIAGSRNYFLKGDGMRLQHAVLQLALSFLHKKGFLLMDPPHIVDYRAMMGTGYFPGGEEQAYHLDERDPGMHLIGTSEVPVASYHADEILDLGQLPLRYAGYSPCYRREAGTYGKDAQGLYRVHQFYKVEQVVICEASEEVSAKMHAELLGNAEELLKLLELPYRVVDNCTGDMGQGQVFKNDIECWMPSRNNYGETHSCSTFGEFQARRLGIRYKGSDGKNRYCHTLNNTLVASPRILIPLLENNQQADGSISIPESLRPFMGGQVSIKARGK
jgi:seryl-tRNA synthetase